MTANPSFRLLAKPLFTLAIGVAATIVSLDAAAQQRSVVSPGRLTVGCPYFTNTSEERNTGFLDDNAIYAIAQVPLSLPEGASIRVEGLSPEVRYWSLQAYDGAQGGNFIDALADVRVTNLAGGVNPANPANLPVAAYGSPYTVRLSYQDPPANPTLRAPNTLYVGAPNPRVSPTRVAKQIIYRIYLPNPGTSRLGNQPVPRMIYSGPEGEIDFQNTPDRRQCDRIEGASSSTRSVNPGIFPKREISFQPVARTEDRILYPNGDSTYLRAASSLKHGSVVVIRTRPFLAPPLPPLLPVSEPEVRYQSLCHYELFSSAVVSCVADRDAVATPDGYELHVISTLESRPATATRANLVNWQRWGTTRGELLVLRQILARPGFQGDYARSVMNPTLPLSLTLGTYAPEITYCLPATFDAAVGSGSAALMNACRASVARR